MSSILFDLRFSTPLGNDRFGNARRRNYKSCRCSHDKKLQDIAFIGIGSCQCNDKPCGVVVHSMGESRRVNRVRLFGKPCENYSHSYAEKAHKQYSYIRVTRVILAEIKSVDNHRGMPRAPYYSADDICGGTVHYRFQLWEQIPTPAQLLSEINREQRERYCYIEKY